MKRWCRKDSVKVKAEPPKANRISADSSSLLINESEDIKARLESLENGLIVMQETVGKLLQLGKETNTDVEKLHISWIV